MYVHSQAQVLLHRQTMGQMMAQLNPEKLLRIHRSYIVNTVCVEALTDRGKDPCYLVLKGNKRLFVSRKYRQNVLNLLSV